MNPYKILSYLIASVWFINGLFCKLLNLVPRHQQIVARILGEEYSFLLTKTIGVFELLMVVWILSGIKPLLCAWTQVLIVITMVAIEVSLAQDLLLFGKLNIIPIVLLIFLILLNQYYFKKNMVPSFKKSMIK